MTSLNIVIAIVLVLLSFCNHPYGSPAGDKPTFTDCRTHIDATIRNLAAKAVVAGEKPTEPKSSDYVSTEEHDDSLPKAPQNVKMQEKAEANRGKTEQNTQLKSEMFISVKEALQQKRQKELESKLEENQKQNHYSQQQKHHGPQQKHHSDITQKVKHVENSKNHTKTVENSRKLVQPAETVKKPYHKMEQPKKYERKEDTVRKPQQKHKYEVKSREMDHKEKKYEYKKPIPYNAHKEKQLGHKSEERQKDHSKYDSHKKTDIKYTSKFGTNKSEGKPKSISGIFNQFIEAVFGTAEIKRDKKFATPWTSHTEFAKKTAEKSKKTTIKGPGFVSKMINKFVGIIFGLPETKRHPKWKEPWQTHKEFHFMESSAKSKAQQKHKDKPWEKNGFFSFSFFNSFVEMIFDKPVKQRDPKFSKPWTTHKEFQRDKSKHSLKKTDVKSNIKHSQPSSGGIFNYIISFFFELPSGHRDPKWNTPWQTHEGFVRTEKEKKKTPVTDVTESGTIGHMLNKAVFLVFEKPKMGRSNKWKKPWQTHEEFLHIDTTGKSKKAVEVKPSEPGFIRNGMNSFVELIFGKNVKQRDPKFSTPWQTHEEFSIIHKSEKKPSLDIKKYSKPVDKHTYVKQEETKVDKQQESVKHEKKETVKSYKEPEKKIFTHADQEHNKAKDETPSVEKASFHHSSKDYKSPSPSKPYTDRLADTPKKSDRPVLEKVAPERKEKIIEYDEQIVVVPSHVRSREHIESIFGLDKIASQSSSKKQNVEQNVLKDLKGIYETTVAPLEKTYKYLDISNRHLTDAELYGPPLVLLLGPYSTGKSSFINYLLGVEFTKRGLKTGTPPSHGVFRIIQYGEHDRNLDGTDLSGQWLFSSLQKFGQNFVDQIRGKTLNIPLLKKVTFVEAPGILEMRRPNERLYPFNDVLQWFIDRADLILVMFDYTKLDAGYEMEATLDQLKGREAQTRILLNKADQVPPEELIKVQGSLFWNLSPLLGVNAPPTVYAGSYASFQYRPTSPIKLFEAQEEALLHDIAAAFKARVNNRIAIVRRHAVRVRNHAQMVDTYVNTFYKNKGFLTSKHKLAEEIIDNPHDYHIYEGLTLQTNVSRYDLPDAEIYRDFFRIHNLYDFPTLRQTCSYIGGCPLEKIDNAINKQLPELIKKYRQIMESGGATAEAPPAFGSEKSSHAGAHARTGKL